MSAPFAYVTPIRRNAKLPDEFLEIEYERPHLYPKQFAAIYDPHRFSLIEASTKAGKAQPLDSVIWTPDGPRLMGSLRVGDLVCTPEGSTPIKAIYPQAGNREICKITFRDNTEVRCDLDHLWEIHDDRRDYRRGFQYRLAADPNIRRRKDRKGWPRILQARDLIAYSTKRLRRLWIPGIEPVQFASQPVPVDPYLIGALIGDGGLSGESVRFSNIDPEIIESVRSGIPSGHRLEKVPGNNADWTITAGKGAPSLRQKGLHLKGILRRLGLHGLSHEKFVPDCYRLNTIDIRWAVLRGILDTDGSVDDHGQPTLEQTSARLAQDVTAIVQSLGGSVYTSLKSVSGYRDKTGEFIRCRPVYRQDIRFADPSKCFALSRKRALLRPRIRSCLRRFKSIEICGTAPTQCIEIGTERGLYLTDGFVPTHNTSGCIAWIVEKALGGRSGWNYWWVAPVSDQALIAFRRTMRSLPQGSFSPNIALKTITLLNGTIIWFKSGDKPNCYDDQTEVLTRRGWRLFREIDGYDEVMTRSPGGEAQWQLPNKIIAVPYAGDMVMISNKRVDIAVTPNHRMLVERRRGAYARGKWDRSKPTAGTSTPTKSEMFVDAAKLKPKDTIPAWNTWAGIDAPGITEDKCAILGFYLAEGSAIGNSSPRPHDLVKKYGYRIFFAQTKGQKGGDKGDVRSAFEEVLNRSEIRYREKRDGVMLWNRDLWSELIGLGNKYTKYIPARVKDLPQEKLRVLLKWMVMGDGSSRRGDQWNYFTVSRRLADDVQEVAIKCGWNATISDRVPSPFQRDGKLSKTAEKLYIVKIQKHAKSHHLSSSQKSYVGHASYSGMVYCVSVPNRTVLVRRSGKPVWSGNSLYGEDVYGVVVDEASRMKHDAYIAIRSTITYTRASIRIIGNVHGRKNWFYKLARQAEHDQDIGIEPREMGYHKIIAGDAVEAGVLDAKEIEDARSQMPEDAWLQLFQAQATDDGGNPFGLAHIKACIKPLSGKRPRNWGWDLGKRVDYTVGIGFDEDGATAAFERFQRIPWGEIMNRIIATTGSTPALVDSTGLGDPVLDLLQKMGGPNFQGYTFTPASKQKLMEGLAVGIQARQVWYPDGVIVSELENFEYVLTRTGVRYSAVEGYHDDCVCALALAKMCQIMIPAPVEVSQGLLTAAAMMPRRRQH